MARRQRLRGSGVAGVSAAVLAGLLLSAVSAPAAPLPTTRNDYKLPGTQPLTVTENFSTPDACTPCHSGFGQPTVEPFRNWQGSMMAQSGRDPLMYAAMAIANQDAAASGETCLRCHLPKGWLEGRSIPEDGTSITADDRQGVQCTICHRLVDPFPDPVNPPEDAAILAALSEPVSVLGGAQMVVDPLERLRGPFDIVADLGSDPHVPTRSTLQSEFHESAELCGICHNVIIPTFTRDASGEYVFNALDTPGDPALGFPEQSTYDEWAASEFATTGVALPRFNEHHAVVRSCQDCHMPHVTGKDANLGLVRDDIPKHSLLGGNTFIPAVLPSHPVFGAEVDAALLAETVDNNTEYLRKAATLSAQITGGNLTVRVQNDTGHKLPTGYPEGRRMWLHVRAVDAAGTVVFESGRYVFSDARLLGDGALPSDPDYDPDLHVWRAVHGISPAFALIAGRPPGPSSHLALNNVREFDNRIPPRGFTNAGYAAFDGQPVGQAFADGQYWDDVVYPVGPDAVAAEVVLYYQTASREYVEFLRDENTTTAAGNLLFDLWNQIDRSTPVEMARAFVQTDAAVLARCSAGVARRQARYAKKYAREWGRCFAAEASGSVCDSVRRDAKLAKAGGKLRAAVGGAGDTRCSGANLTPISIGHGPVCPAPCSEQTVFDMGELADCSLCLSAALYEDVFDAAYGSAPPDFPAAAPSGAPAGCQKLIAKASLKLAAAWSAALARCEGDNRSGKNNPPLDCSTDPEGRIARAIAKADRKIERCKDFTGLLGCAAGGSAAFVKSCVQAAVGPAATSFVEGAYP